MVECDCVDWKESWPQIESSQTLAAIHGSEYTGKVFSFCPWCGNEFSQTKAVTKAMNELEKSIDDWNPIDV